MGKDVNICHHYWKSGVVLDYGINLEFSGAVRAGGLEQAELGAKHTPLWDLLPAGTLGSVWVGV